jgi:long-chain acyl-CoA synthetase
MTKIWHRQYDPGVPHEIDPDAYTSVWSMAEGAIGKYGSNRAFHNFGATLSFDDIDRLSRDFAAYLQSDLGLAKGDRIAIMTPNIMAFPITLFAVLRAGLVQVNVNPLYTPRELKHQLNDADTETIVIFSGSTSVLAEIVGETKIKNTITANLGDFGNAELSSPPVDERLEGTVAFTDAVAKGGGRPFESPAITGDDLLFLQYTGGTTGLSKGAVLTHRNLVANIVAMEACFDAPDPNDPEIVITALPLYHIFALMVNCLVYFLRGGLNVLITNPRDMEGFVKELGNWQFSVMTGVNTLYNGLLHTPGFAELDFSKLKVVAGGGTAIQEAVSTHFKDVTGMHIKEGYGLSETSPVVTFNPIKMTRFTNSIGVPVPSTDVSIRDDENREMPVGEPGELCVKGPQVMQGYWRQPEATAAVMTEDGYFRTGDIALMTEEGFFRIVDRKKDMVLVSGFNVYPNEIETVMAGMDGALESASIGIPDDHSGEAVKLFVVRAEGGEITADEVEAYCRENLTAYKVPKHIEFIDALPKSPVGKILRRELRD